MLLHQDSTELLARLFQEPETKRRIKAGTPTPLGGAYETLAAAECLARMVSVTDGHMTGRNIFIDGRVDVVIRGDSMW
jgi:hypothetical protein